LGFNTVQASSETEFNISVKDAHTGEYVDNLKDVKITGNNIKHVIHENIDVEFSPMAGIKATWDDADKKYNLSSGLYTGAMHLSSNGFAFQTCANSGESLFFDMGAISTRELGVESVSVLTRESAAKSVMLIDKANDKIITKRTRIGGYIGTLDRNIENLSNASSNLTAAKSRIIDANMAKETAEYVKLRILADSGMSVLAQANQVPEAVVRLLN
ncbi:MAG: flagellin, partial [Synergistaceae bacterium]|nr:flagellin [Synergistaceae bacterium]